MENDIYLFSKSIKMKRLLPTFLAVLLLFTVDSCKKNNPEPTEPEPTPGTAFHLDETTGYPGEALTIVADINLAQDNYVGTVNTTSVTFYRAGKNLSFSVPDLAAGNYTVSVSIDGEACELALQVLNPLVISDPDQYLADYMSENDAIYDANTAFIDSMIANGEIDPATAAHDAAIWNNIRQQANAEFSSMTAAQKQELSELLEANKDWIDALSIAAPNNYFTLKSAECEALRVAGQQANNSGLLYKALGIAVEFKWCQAQEYIDANTDNALSKTIAILENTDDIWAINTLTNFIGLKIKALSDELDQLGKEEFVAEELEDNGEKAVLIWESGEVKNVFAQIKFRSPKSSDANQSGVLGGFSSTFSEFISAYDDYVQHIDQALIWRPEFMDQTKVVDFDRFLSVENVSNSEVILLNTQTVGDNWQVVFATDALTDQDFSYDLVYNDGHVNLSKTFQATVNASQQQPTLAIGDFHEGGVIFYLDASGEHGMVCSIYDLPTGDWGCDGIFTGANGPNIGDGEQNTNTIVTSSCASGYVAAASSYNSVANGYSDWFLPSSGEMVAMFNNTVQDACIANGGDAFADGSNPAYLGYWTSTEHSGGADAAAIFWEGNNTYDLVYFPKYAYLNYVRPARSF